MAFVDVDTCLEKLLTVCKIRRTIESVYILRNVHKLLKLLNYSATHTAVLSGKSRYLTPAYQILRAILLMPEGMLLGGLRLYTFFARVDRFFLHQQ